MEIKTKFSIEDYAYANNSGRFIRVQIQDIKITVIKDCIHIIYACHDIEDPDEMVIKFTEKNLFETKDDMIEHITEEIRSISECDYNLHLDKI